MSRDYERLCQSSQAMIYAVNIAGVVDAEVEPAEAHEQHNQVPAEHRHSHL